MEEDTVRLYVGGLASEVNARDLQERFEPLGRVQSVVLAPLKGEGGAGHRGFAYVDFTPATDASLRKLFSAYNGCKWRGGSLRIEKAKEHYTDRLNREWASAAEEAILSMTEVPEQVDVDQRSVKANGRENGGRGVSKDDSSSTGLKIFFPRFKKMKTVPLSGLGKHKRSFQRVESSPLHLLSGFDCDEAMPSGSRDCAKMINHSSTSKVEVISEADDISLEIVRERERQLELLSRLFPSDAASDRLDEQPAVEIDEGDGRGGGARRTGACETTSMPAANEGRNFGQPERLSRTETENFNQNQEGKLESGVDGDSTVQLMGNERAEQLQLMNGPLSGNEAPIARGPERARPEVSKTKGKRKRDLREEDPHSTEFSMITPNSQKKDGETRIGQGSNEASKAFMHEETLAPLSGHLLQDNPEEISGLGDSGSSPLREDEGTKLLKEPSPDIAGDLPEEDDDSDMVLNLGVDELSPAIAGEREKLLLKNLFMTADEAPLQKNPEADPAVPVGSLSQGGPSDQGLQTPKSPQEVLSDDSLEDAELTLNISYDTVPPSSVEERERQMPIGMPSGDNPFTRTAAPVAQQSKKLGALGSSNDEAPHPAPVPRIDESKPSLRVESDADRTKGPQRDGVSQSDQKLTRAAWKSLVGETGRVVFSLRQAIGSSASDVPLPSPTQETPGLDKDILSPLNSEKANDETLEVNNSDSASFRQAVESDSRRGPGRQFQMNRTEPIRTAPTPSPSSDNGCLFMKSEHAEREWLTTKSKLRSDYRAKHRYAARHMKKLWNK